MIVLTIDQKNWLVNFLETEGFAASMRSKNLAVVPIEFKNGWMLPEAVLNDPRCSEAKARLDSEGRLSHVVYREVTQDELIEYEL
jgi:hypothetical protein